MGRPDGVETVHEGTARGPTVDQTVHGHEKAKAQDASKENKGRNSDADDVAHREQGHRQIHARIEASGNERYSAFDRVVRHFEAFDHQAVEATDAQGVHDGKRTVAALFSSDQYFTARNTFRIGQGLFNDEQPPQGDGEHGAKQPPQGGDDERLHPLNVGPYVHDQQGWYGEDHTRRQ